MTGHESRSIDERVRVAASVRNRVGAIFGTVRRGRGICEVCAGPAREPLCGTCEWHRRAHGTRLADLVVPLAYAVRGQQSGHHMFGYKAALASSADVLRDVKFLMWGAAYLHRHCISAKVGRSWSAVTFVPSLSRPGVEHPVVELARQISVHDESALKFLVDLGPSITSHRREGPLPDRFVVSDRWLASVRDRHVLVVDDTWVAGRNAQSVAIALKAAGAGAVTIVCAARWLDRGYDNGHGVLIDDLTGHFDPMLCPVTGDVCP